MYLLSIFTVLSVATLTSAVKLQNTFNGLCLDAPDGMDSSKPLRLVSCDKVQHGDWSVLSGDNGTIWIKNNISNGAEDWCLDFNPDRSAHITLWRCNTTPAQRFIRDPNTRQGRLSFMTTQERKSIAGYELAVRPEDKPGALADFLPVVPNAGKLYPRHEWIEWQQDEGVVLDASVEVGGVGKSSEGAKDDCGCL